MFNTIIVPTDFSDEESTIKSLKKASILSDTKKVVLMHATDNEPYDVSITREVLTKIVDAAGVQAEIEVRHNGAAHNDIIASAKENNADLIMINSHKPGIQDYLIGSTATDVVRHAQCNVLIVR